MTTVLHSQLQYPNERVEMDNRETIPVQSPSAGPSGPAAIEVAQLVKLYKTTRAVDDISFSIARGSKPDGTEVVAVNVSCIDGIELAKLAMTPVDGRNR